jgi:hypothetical protein
MAGQFKVGDVVMYSRQTLRACGLYLGPYGFMKGEVERIDELGLSGGAVAWVKWRGENGRPVDVPAQAVLTSALIRADRRHLEAA